MTEAGRHPSTDALFCARCGQPVDGGGHDRCAATRSLEPPRFCPDCGRRMKVQVTPLSWTATCGRHGPVGQVRR